MFGPFKLEFRLFSALTFFFSSGLNPLLSAERHFVIFIFGVIRANANIEEKLQVAFLNVFINIPSPPRWTSANEMFISSNVLIFYALLRNFM